MAKVSISQAWDESRAVLARDGKLIVPVALALLLLPGLIVNVLVPRPTTGQMPEAGLWLVVALPALLVTFAGQLSVVRLAMGPHVTVGDAIRHAAGRTLQLFGAFLAWFVPFGLIGSVPYAMILSNPSNPPAGAALALLAITLIGMFVAVRLLLIGPVAGAEKAGVFGVLRRSWKLTAGNWWRLFGFLVLFAIGAIALIWAVGSVVGLLARLAFGQLTTTSVGGLIVIIVAQALTASVYVVLFVMQTRIYVQLSGRGEVDASVPTTGT
jgi:hypothetical protein